MMMWDWTESERVLEAWSEWAVDAPDHVTTSFRIMQMPPLPEIPEPIRGRSIVLIDGAVQGDPAVIEPLRALGPELDTFAMVPAPSLVRLHQDPEEPMPYTSDSALVRELPAEAVKTLIELSGPGSGSPLAIVELRQVGGALSRADARPRRRRRRRRPVRAVRGRHGARRRHGGVHARPHGPDQGRAGAVARRRLLPQLRRGDDRPDRRATARAPTSACGPSRPGSTRTNAIRANHSI